MPIGPPALLKGGVLGPLSPASSGTCRREAPLPTRRRRWARSDHRDRARAADQDTGLGYGVAPTHVAGDTVAALARRSGIGLVGGAAASRSSDAEGRRPGPGPPHLAGGLAR